MDDSFFKELVKNLAFIVKVDHIFISRAPVGKMSDYIDTIAFLSDGKFVDNVRLELEGTPCKEVIEGNVRFYSKDIQKLFPEAEVLVKLGVESYLGCPIFSHSGLVLGHISIIGSAQLKNEQELTKTVQAFASLASSEFERVRAEVFNKSVLESALDAFVAINAKGKVTMWNRQAEITFGWSEGEVTGKPLEQFIVPRGEKTAHRKGIKRLIKTGQSGELHFLNRRIEINAQHRDGHTFPVELTITPVLFGDEIVSFSAFIRDLTEEKKQEALQHAELNILEMITQNKPQKEIFEQLCLAMENQASAKAFGSVLLVNRDTSCLELGAAPSFNKQVQEALDGLSIGECRGSCAAAVFRKTPIFVSDVREDPVWAELREFAKEHHIEACWSMPFYSETGEVLGSFALTHSVSVEPTNSDIRLMKMAAQLAGITIERSKSHQALIESEEKFRSAFGKAPIVVTLVDCDGIVLQCNEKAYDLLGYAEEEIVGRPIGEFTHTDDLERSMRMFQLLVSGEIDHYEIEKRYISKSGDVVWAQLNISSVRDAEQNFLYAIAHNLDITERKRSEIDLYERAEEESVFANLLKFSFLPIDEYMQLSLDEILSVSWTKVEDKGGIFLTKEQGNNGLLQLVTSKKMPDELLTLYNNVDFATCPCGWAAETRQIQFDDCVDEHYENHFEGMTDHGHYSIPIINDGKSLGIIVLHLAEGNQSQKSEVDFLKRAADVLSLGIARKYAEEKVNYQAAHDSLTGLISRREFESRLQQVLTAGDSNDEHALCYLDLDQFKVINDECGHLAGDELLHQLANLLQSKVRKRDTLARLGGDEFGLLMEHCSIGEAMRVAESLRKSVEEFRFAWDKKNFSLGVSIGLVPIISGKSNVKGVLGDADAACYAAKDAGRNRIHIYNPEDVELAQRRGEMKWVTKIKDAIDEDRLRLYIQPIVPLSAKDEERNKKHYECLIRMIDKNGKIIPPGAFLPAAERYDLSARIDRWVFESTYAWLDKRPGKSKGLTSCSVNLSGHSLGNEEFLQLIVKKLDDGNVLPSSICFEITETVAISRLGNAIRFMEVLKDKGCSFALDDFGSGVSSFGYLKNLPVDYIKIDGMFVRDMVGDPIDLEMVRSINEIGHVMGKKTIAEFVENQETLDCLKELGIDFAQGFHVGKPRAIKVPLIPSEDKGKTVRVSKPKHKRYRRTRKTD